MSPPAYQRGVHDQRQREQHHPGEPHVRQRALGEDADVRTLDGWRREVFGEDALRLRRGELALAIEGKNLKPVPINPD